MATAEPGLRMPAEIRARALRRWENESLLQAWLRGEQQFPMVFPCRPPPAGNIPDAFIEVRQWIQALREQSKERLGFGYSVEFEEVNHRRLGRQTLPCRVRFDTLDELLRFVDRYDAFVRFCSIMEIILAAQPSLRNWLERYPLKVLVYENAWPAILRVLEYFQVAPRPNLYLRELSISGVDTKFVEAHKPLLRELMDMVLPPEAIDSSVTTLAGSGFEQRYGLRHDQPLIRFRLLDPSLMPSWPMRDLAVPLDEFVGLDLPCRRVFVTENKINGLAFPDVDKSIVLFGLGYGVSSLMRARWLEERELHYWGDIDTHGFAILSQFRGCFPDVRSFCMDLETIHCHAGLQGRESEGARCVLPLSHLSEAEQKLYHALVNDEFGVSLRLEQERIPWNFVMRRLRQMLVAALELEL